MTPEAARKALEEMEESPTCSCPTRRWMRDFHQSAFTPMCKLQLRKESDCKYVAYEV